MESLKNLIGKIWHEKMENRVFIGVVFFIGAFLVIFCLDIWVGPDMKDILVEANGMLMDILIFGVLMAFFDLQREQKFQTNEYCKQLDDYCNLSGLAIVYRKAEIIKRLITMGEKLPSLTGMELCGVDLQGINLSKAKLLGANLFAAKFNGAILQEGILKNANLREANFSDVDLSKANLRGACLDKTIFHNTKLNGTDLSNATGLYRDQIDKKIIIDKDTRFPDYIKIKWLSEDAYEIENDEKSA